MIRKNYSTLNKKFKVFNFKLRFFFFPLKYCALLCNIVHYCALKFIKSLIHFSGVSDKEQGGKAKSFLIPCNCDNNFKLNQFSFAVSKQQ